MAVAAGPGPHHDFRALMIPQAQARPVGGVVGDDVLDAAFDLRADEGAALTYTTPPFTQNVEISGPITLRLLAASTAADLVWVVRITDVWPDGRSIWVTDQVLRASLRRIDEGGSVRNAEGDIVIPRHWFDASQPLYPRDIEEYTIHVGDVSNVFQAGYRLRLDIIGIADSPTDAPAVPSVVTVYHDPARPSSLLLPVIPARCQESWAAFDDVVHPGECAGSMADAL